jgi:hypothetical protein
MRVLLVENKENGKTVADLFFSVVPLVGDEIAVLNGDASATYQIVSRRFFPPSWGSMGREEYIVMNVDEVDL